MSDELDKIRKESGWKPRKRGKSQVTMDLLQLGSYAKFSCSLIKSETRMAVALKRYNMEL